jgi:hypothetical protein
MHSSREHYSGRIGIGIFFIVVGLLLFYGHYQILSIDNPWHLWPLIPIVIGLVRITNARYAWEYRKGCGMLFIGLWFMACELHLFGLTYHNSWPLLIIFAGISMVWKTFSRSHSCHQCRQEEHYENQ